ncbi:MAG: sulfur carrier protein ThiS [Hyphomicrobiaceae bacterium]|nr:sulfur carrier protein ThiS [Hyphomicrobiaceae bacterium]
MADTPDTTATRPVPTLRVVLNGMPMDVAAGSLEAFLDARGFADAKVATAVNGTFVPARARSTHQLAAGDHIEVVSARQGG